MRSKSCKIDSIEELSSFAKDFSITLSGGEVVLLAGELGAGKTTFVKELVKALGSSEVVNSPTFVLRNEYSISNKTFFHIDLYRLEKNRVKSFEFFERLGDVDTITCIEWPERIKDVKNIPGRIIKLTFLRTGEHSRKIKIS